MGAAGHVYMAACAHMNLFEGPLNQIVVDYKKKFNDVSFGSIPASLCHISVRAAVIGDLLQPKNGS